MRNLGLLLALSTPITAFITFALVAITIGEARLEDASGATPLGYLVMALPLIVGLAFAAYAHFGGLLPTRNQSALVLAAFGLVCIAAGLVSTLTSDDASIGGGFLFMFGPFPIVAAVTLVLTAKRTPPPPGPPIAPAPPTAPPPM